jgi:hypothetical protein
MQNLPSTGLVAFSPTFQAPADGKSAYYRCGPETEYPALLTRLTRLALTGLNTFLCSAEREPDIIHLPVEDECYGLSADKIWGPYRFSGMR